MKLIVNSLFYIHWKSHITYVFLTLKKRMLFHSKRKLSKNISVEGKKKKKEEDDDMPVMSS